MTGSAAGVPVERLAWDSDHFGFAVAKVRDPASPERLRAASAAADEMGIRCLTALVAADRAAAITTAEEVGFRCYDVRIEFDREVRSETVDADGIRHAGEADLPSLEPIARTRFSASRFSVDPHFQDDRVGDLYVAWLRRGLQAEDRLLLTTAELDGFAVCHLDREVGVGSIELVAVAARSEGAGLGSRLMHGAERAFAQAGLTEARVTTQGRNLQAQRLYQRYGYRTRGVALWLHRWS